MAHKKKKGSIPSKKIEKSQNISKADISNNTKDDFKDIEQLNETKQPFKTSENKNISKKDNKEFEKEYKNSVSRSALYFSIAFSVFFGIYLGTMLPSFFNEPGVVHNIEAQAEISQEASARILELEQIVLKNPNDVASWINLGNIYFDTHKHEESIHAYEKALELKPDNADVLTDLGIMYRSVSDYEKAVANFAKASEADPRHENSLLNSGIVLYFDLGRKEDARNKWRELLKLNPNAKAPDGSSVEELIKGNF